jgi:Ca2+-binding RTX toxin-like protein
MTPRLLLAAATAAAALAVPAAAHGSTVTTDGDALVLTGGAGGTLAYVGVTGDGRLSLDPTYADPPTALAAGCAQADAGEPILCDMPARLRVVMGDGDDDVDVSNGVGIPVEIDGGAGNDELTGNIEGGQERMLGGAGDDSLKGYAGGDHLEGGPGNDRVDGGTGADVVLGGDGDDRVIGDGDLSGATDPDVIDGGPGYDLLDDDYSTVGREGKGLITLTLDAGADDGFAGEGDEVRGIEKVDTAISGTYVGTDARDELYVGAVGVANVQGRGGDDTIYTSYDNDTIDGGAGNDTIRGYAGDDAIVGGPGQDSIFGDTQGQTCNVMTCSVYSGNDVIDARDGERDSVDCGLGTDIALVDAVDVTSNCEDVRQPATGGGGTPQGGTTQGGTTQGGTTSGGTTQGGTTSGGKARCVVPKKVAKQTKAGVAKKLKKAGCRVKYKTIRSKKVSKGRVVKVSRKGATATVYVSKGRR